MTAPVARTAFLSATLLATAFLASPALAGGGCFSSECYRRVTTPPVFDTVSEQRLVAPPRTVYRTVPPVYDTVSERVLVAPGGRRWETRYDAYGQLVGCWVTIPPQYAVRTRRVLVREAQVIPETVPPVYASYQRRVLVQPARSAWVPAGPAYGGPGPIGAIGAGIGSIPDAIGIAGASSADVAVGLGFSTGSVYDGY
ncbi:hypothetical protein [Methylobacterium organophilum]|uniref:YD repeat protein n=1 Tax=Methylobacterium organophilum TaxID=410 RepID=A0ABQ4TD01_METOR|nr:hypothetical protein [Methylobacterium organophilum]UMY16087.1 hypothetical protein MMB17_15320 [Methylobacterium organophilum]GJE28946.1 hypothetical protein LKMONMHP_3821 [Methylobacterium organophilum]